ncbi:MAG: MGMT family protein [Sporocytophaga sp.]|nr:MGMT family protein [Sporocytophaga sp.]
MLPESFFENVNEVVKLIPKGKVTSYGAIAKYLGIKSGARMVGWALKASHIHKNIPAHRVVNRSGLLTGKMRFSSPTLMQEKLEMEGIQVVDDKIKDFNLVFWDPSIELI